jgi:hypothetical protein
MGGVLTEFGYVQDRCDGKGAESHVIVALFGRLPAIAKGQ